MSCQVSSSYREASLLLLFLHVLAVDFHIQTAQALEEVQVNSIANENCTSYLGPFHVSVNSVGTYGNISEMKNTAENPEASHLKCPPWYFRKDGGWCRAGRNFNSLVNVEQGTQQTWLQILYCMTTSNQNATRTDIIGSCLFSFNVGSYYPLPCDISILNKYMCAGLNKEGQLCGRCVKNFAPPVFSYALSCVNCTNYQLNWLKYMGVAFGPLTLFCLLICVLHISATSPYLHGFIFYSQIITMPTVVRMVANTNGYKEAIASTRIGAQVYVSLLSIWNLDIFRAFYQPFCIHPDMTVVQALALDYIIALYPLILILITFMLVSLHSRNNVIIVTLWGPFKKILRPFFHHLNIETSLIESFATLYLLSVMKIQSVTLDLLSPTTLYHVDGRINDKLLSLLGWRCGILWHRTFTIRCSCSASFLGVCSFPYTALISISLWVFSALLEYNSLQFPRTENFYGCVPRPL